MVDLKLKHVSKRYLIPQEATGRAARRSLMKKLHGLWDRRREFWAVRDVSFEVGTGEALGIIGPNGAGKSTILKLLSGITGPTSGELEINGRLSALIEVGSGFHPELTGRENIFLNGSILGMRRREIAQKLDSILDFAGVRDFADVPVKRFSSGMYVRLGFSVAAHLNPDILLLDEVLAVGDAAFQARCLRRIDDLKKDGTTIIFISHDLTAVESLCDRVLLMQRGEIIADGPPRDVVSHYRHVAAISHPSALSISVARSQTKPVEITSVSFLDADGSDTRVFRTGDPLTISIEYMAREFIEDAAFDLVIGMGTNTPCQLTTEASDERIDIHPGPGTVQFFCPELGLRPGGYNVDVRVKTRDRLEGFDWKGAMLNVSQGKLTTGAFYMPHTWSVEQGPAIGIDAQVESCITLK